MSFILQKKSRKRTGRASRRRALRISRKIVAQGISAQLLEWKGIEATEKLAASQNTKIVVIGNTKNGLPLVFEPK